ncbi:non-specific lipid transfer protein GPI-anchored 7-like [Solanum stenotomum]|uniref:non-specific lipid transfer protein GPI-anchored 7-like n=1 Tax=Solanum stenotomum TaxID=172797 RepID=UPI0020D1BB36|nr:non-specific lipid transfer protein GPI-anchored 7-like [Solanum stenotomum]
MFSSKFSWLITAALLSAIITDAQTTSCASKLVPCAPFLNSTSNPSASCCDPLREAVNKDLQCICKLFENPTLLPSLGINVTQVIALLKNCNIPGDVNTCKAGGPSSPSPSKGASPGKCD